MMIGMINSMRLDLGRALIVAMSLFVFAGGVDAGEGIRAIENLSHGDIVNPNTPIAHIVLIQYNRFAQKAGSSPETSNSLSVPPLELAIEQLVDTQSDPYIAMDLEEKRRFGELSAGERQEVARKIKISNEILMKMLGDPEALDRRDVLSVVGKQYLPEHIAILRDAGRTLKTQASDKNEPSAKASLEALREEVANAPHLASANLASALERVYSGSFETRDGAEDNSPVPIMPKMTRYQLLDRSGEFSLGALHRNLIATNWGDALRERAFAAHRKNRPLEIVEITPRLPLNALPFLDERYLRSLGDHMVAYQGHDFAPPERRVTVVTPRDLTRSFLSEPTLKKFDDLFLYTSIYNSLATMIGGYNFNGIPKKSEVLAAYQEAIEKGRIKVREGEAVAEIKKLKSKSYDIVISHELAWTRDRIALLNVVQRILRPGGRAFFSLQWWRPREDGGGTVERIHFNDVVQVGGRKISLAQWLAMRYPDAYEVLFSGGAKMLVVKGTAKRVKLPQMESQATGSVVEGGFPTLSWSLPSGTWQRLRAFFKR